MKINKLVLLAFMMVFTSCYAQNTKEPKINTKFNKEYASSRKSFVGKLNNVEYKELRNRLLNVLRAEIPDNNAILINYYQKGSNCYEYGLGKKDALTVIENCIRISSQISRENNTTDFFLYSDKTPNKERIENRNNFILDSGFFEENIFTLKENCRAFFILKTNGEFMKYYGSDYYSEVKKFLEKK
ncbi:hypothetical protein [Pedobacter sp. UBA4863]|uniref:hypothetical protein n=1 Tax=Pedobacter sp. UBA4863 TaxID=1947060 RepID=UPI0025EBD91C|nr:hypothetical protein [Pedobacter sp. UBA4863]